MKALSTFLAATVMYASLCGVHLTQPVNKKAEELLRVQESTTRKASKNKSPA